MDMSFFENALFRQEEEIREKVEALNRSLRPIAYTPSTYIQLRTDAARDVQIREFKFFLKSIFADNEGSTAAGEASFLKIKNLIDRFDHDERWTRKVTDVRNWLDFSMSERYLETGEEKSFITGSAGLSGGQKAKLAYTILAAAIAYQFGLDYGEPRSNSFRLVVIDEAFRAFVVPGTPLSEADVHALPHLTPEEQALFEELTRKNLRMEQERIPLAFVADALATYDAASSTES